MHEKRDCLVFLSLFPFALLHVEEGFLSNRSHGAAQRGGRVHARLTPQDKGRCPPTLASNPGSQVINLEFHMEEYGGARVCVCAHRAPAAPHSRSLFLFRALPSVSTCTKEPFYPLRLCIT